MMNENEKYSTSADGFSFSSINTTDDGDDGDDDDVSSADRDKGLYDLSELMAHLPIKRGLSKHYQGKSESFKNLSKAASLEDLSKKVVSQTSDKNKCSKNRRNNHNNNFIQPKAVIKKKNPARNLFSSSSFCRRRTGFSSTMQQHLT